MIVPTAYFFSWDIVAIISVIPKFSNNSYNSLYTLIIGFPSGFRKTSMSFKLNFLIPVPRAFERASFSAKFPAILPYCKFSKSNISNSLSVKFLFKNLIFLSTALFILSTSTISVPIPYIFNTITSYFII